MKPSHVATLLGSITSLGATSGCAWHDGLSFAFENIMRANSRILLLKEDRFFLFQVPPYLDRTEKAAIEAEFRVVLRAEDGRRNHVELVESREAHARYWERAGVFETDSESEFLAAFRPLADLPEALMEEAESLPPGAGFIVDGRASLLVYVSQTEDASCEALCRAEEIVWEWGHIPLTTECGFRLGLPRDGKPELAGW